MFVSPAEPAKIKLALGDECKVSSLPEKYGCDMLFYTQGQWVGIQRKEVNDLLASVNDGRLAKETQQMQSHCTTKILIVEGQVRWTNSGEMYGQNFGRKWNKKQWKALLWSVRQKGIWVEFTDDAQDTAEHCLWLQQWLGKSAHRGLDTRPGPTSIWGNPRNEDYQRHLVQGFPGVGYELAERIVEKFGVPFKWNITIEQLMEIPGIGKKKAEKIWACLA